MRRPGDRARSIASRLFAAETMDRVIDPILADLQWEYDEARAHGLAWRARSLLHGYVAFARALFWIGVRTAWPADGARADIARACLVMTIASAVVTVALALPPLLDSRSQSDPAFTALLFVMLVPQALPLSIPAGLCVAVLWAMRGKAVTVRRITTVLAIALASTAVVWIVLEWLMPQANQGFREMVVARISGGRVVTLEPGLSELGLSRLGQRTDPDAVRHYQVLWALCFASVPIGLLAMGLARRIRRAASAVVLAIVLANAYFALLWATAASTAASTPTFVAAWMPNVICLVIGGALLARDYRSPA